VTAVETEVQQLTMAEAENQGLSEIMAKDDRVFILGEDISDRTGGSFRVTAGLTNEYGVDRVRDTPIAEQAIIGAAIGAAMGGMRPVAEIMIMDFMMVAMDQIANHAAKLRYMTGGRTNVPLTIRTVVTGGVHGTGAQHSQSLEAWLAHIPGLKVVIPSTPADAKGLLLSCIEDEDPCVFIEYMDIMYTKGPVPVGEDFRVPLGQAAVRREGTDLTIVTYGRMVQEALAAAEELAGEGTSVEVIDLRTIVPLDTETILASVAKTRRAVVVQSSTKVFGVGAELATRIGEANFGKLLAPVGRLGAVSVPNPVATNLETAMYPTKADILEAVRTAVQYK